MPHGIKLVPLCDLQRSQCTRFLSGPESTLPPPGRAITHDALSIPNVIRYGAALSYPLSAVPPPMRASPTWLALHVLPPMRLARSSAPFPHVFVEAIITCRRKPTSWMICCGNLAQHGKGIWSYGVTVSTLDSESSDRGSNPRRTFTCVHERMRVGGLSYITLIHLRV